MEFRDSPREPLILSAVRTPMGRFQGEVSRLSATDRGAIAVREAVLPALTAYWPLTRCKKNDQGS